MKRDAFVNNSIVFFIGSTLASGGNYIYQFFMVRMLDVDHYGTLQSLIAVSTLLSIFSATLMTVLIQYTAQFHAKKQPAAILALFSYATRRTLLGIGIFLGLFLIFSKEIVSFLHLPSAVPLLIVGGTMAGSFLLAINNGILNGTQRFHAQSLLGIIAAILKVTLAVGLVYLGFAVNGAIGALALVALASYGLSFLPLKALFKEPTIPLDVKPVVRFALPTFFMLFFINFFFNIDIILVKHFFSATEAGQYGALTVLGHIIFFVVGPMVGVLLPMAAAQYSAKEDHQLIFYKSLCITLGIGIAVAAMFFLIPRTVVTLSMGNNFLVIAPYLGWFAAAMLLCALINLFSHYFISIQSTKSIYVLGIGALAELAGMYWKHNSLAEIIWIMNVVFLCIVLAQVAYFIKIRSTVLVKETV